MVPDGHERLLVGDAEALAQNDGGDGAMEEYGVVARVGVDRDTDLAGKTNLLSGGLGAEKVVPPDRQLDTFLVGEPVAGQGQGFVQHAADVADEPGRAQQELLAHGGDLVGDHPSWPSWRPPTRWRWRWWMVMPAASPTLKASR